MFFRQLVFFIVSLGRYATGNVDVDLCVDSELAFRETQNGADQNCTSTKLECDASPAVRSHCKEKCDVPYCCEDTKAPFFVVPLGDGKSRVVKSCDKAKKYCRNNPAVTSACPVTCKKCIPHSISDILWMIDKNAATNIAEFERQAETNSGLLTKIDANTADVETQGERVSDLANRYRFGDYEYFFVIKNKTWEDHDKAANEWGGHLASVHSNDESIFMMSLARNYNYWVFIDGVRSGDTIVNTDGTAFDYLNWCGGNPHGGAEIYMVMRSGDISNQDGMCIADTGAGSVFAAIYKREIKYL